MGAVQILTHSMVQSIEENSVRKGYDPRDFALVAEGGAGPLFAAQIALEVGTPTVVVPPWPGIAAALGLLATDMVYEYVATTYQRLSKLDASALQSRFEESDIEIPNIRVRGIGLTPALQTPEIEQGDDSPDAALRHEGSAWFRVGGALAQVQTRYYERAALKAGNRLVGPAIVTQYDSTTVIPPGLAARVDRFGNIVIGIAESIERQPETEMEVAA